MVLSVESKMLDEAGILQVTDHSKGSVHAKRSKDRNAAERSSNGLRSRRSGFHKLASCIALHPTQRAGAIVRRVEE